MRVARVVAAGGVADGTSVGGTRAVADGGGGSTEGNGRGEAGGAAGGVWGASAEDAVRGGVFATGVSVGEAGCVTVGGRDADGRAGDATVPRFVAEATGTSTIDATSNPRGSGTHRTSQVLTILTPFVLGAIHPLPAGVTGTVGSSNTPDLGTSS